MVELAADDPSKMSSMFIGSLCPTVSFLLWRLVVVVAAVHGWRLDGGGCLLWD